MCHWPELYDVLPLNRFGAEALERELPCWADNTENLLPGLDTPPQGLSPAGGGGTQEPLAWVVGGIGETSLRAILSCTQSLSQIPTGGEGVGASPSAEMHVLAVFMRAGLGRRIFCLEMRLVSEVCIECQGLTSYLRL